MGLGTWAVAIGKGKMTEGNGQWTADSVQWAVSLDSNRGSGELTAAVDSEQ
jgi:hypothetical protein